MALLTVAGTFVLAAFAIVTAWYARKAFLKQSQEVLAIESQVPTSSSSPASKAS